MLRLACLVPTTNTYLLVLYIQLRHSCSSPRRPLQKPSRLQPMSLPSLCHGAGVAESSSRMSRLRSLQTCRLHLSQVGGTTDMPGSLACWLDG